MMRLVEQVISMIDERVTTPVPEDIVGVEVTANGEKKVFQRGQWLMFFKVQYGYRRAPQLWQLHLIGLLKENFDG